MGWVGVGVLDAVFALIDLVFNSLKLGFARGGVCRLEEIGGLIELLGGFKPFQVGIAWVRRPVTR